MHFNKWYQNTFHLLSFIQCYVLETCPPCYILTSLFLFNSVWYSIMMANFRSLHDRGMVPSQLDTNVGVVAKGMLRCG